MWDGGEGGGWDEGLGDSEASVRQPTQGFVLGDTVGHHVKLAVEVSPPSLSLDIESPQAATVPC